MADKTRIEWADATVNAINGCTVTSPGCTHCYAMKQAHRFDARRGLTRQSNGGMVWTGEVRLNEKALLQPLSWKRPRRIFWNAHGDTFHESVPDEWIDRVLAVCALTPRHTHMILTKRAKRMREYMGSTATRERIARKMLDNYRAWGVSAIPTLIDALANRAEEADPSIAAMPIRNVWLGVSVEDQTRAEERIPDLLTTPAAVRFLSCEPLLGPIDLAAIEVNCGDGEMDALNPINISSEWRDWLEADDGTEEEALVGFVEQYGRVPDGKPIHPTIDWVIAGGESGTGARPMHPDWARSLRDQCAGANVPFHFKQWGEWAPLEAFGGVSDGPITDRKGNVRDWMNRYVICADRGDRLRGHSFTEHATDLVYKVGKKRAGRLLDGVTHDGFPFDCGWRAHQGTRWGRKMWGKEVRAHLAYYGEASGRVSGKPVEWPADIAFPWKGESDAMPQDR